MEVMDISVAAHNVEDADPTYLETKHKLTRAQWAKIFLFLGQLKNMIMFYMGDAIHIAEHQLGESAPDVIQYSGLSVSECEDAERLARTFPPGTRYKDLPWSYHRDAGSDVEIAAQLLQAALNNDWSRDQLREARKELLSRLGADQC
jgi:hypothetical protein